MPKKTRTFVVPHKSLTRSGVVATLRVKDYGTFNRPDFSRSPHNAPLVSSLYSR